MTKSFDRLVKQLAGAMKSYLSTGAKPIIPEAGALLWQIFAQIADSRTWHAAGPNPISYAEIEAWARLHRWPLQPHHVAALRALDNAFIEQTYATKLRGDGKAIPRSSGQAVTPAAFDAVFR
jgi:hypothetical protein